jgi:hypothetical protein
MPQARGDKEYLVPIRGLNTEQSDLHADLDYFSDGLNFEVKFDPIRLAKRLGLSVGTRFASQSGYPNDNAFTTFLWKAVDNDGDKNFIVVQAGLTIYFVDADVDPIGSSVHTETVDLSTVLSGTTFGTSDNARKSRCQFANAKGNLLIVNPACNPVVVTYDASVPSITVTEINIKIRDTIGIADGLEVDERPTTLSDEHHYNLLNQGWYKQRKVVAAGSPVDPINNVFSTKGYYPSNADIPHLAMVESSGELIFSAERLEELTFGSSPAPKGHFILDAFNMDRETARLNPSSSGAASSGSGTSGLDGTTKTPGTLVP